MIHIYICNTSHIWIEWICNIIDVLLPYIHTYIYIFTWTYIYIYRQIQPPPNTHSTYVCLFFIDEDLKTKTETWILSSLFYLNVCKRISIGKIDDVNSWHLSWGKKKTKNNKTSKKKTYNHLFENKQCISSFILHIYIYNILFCKWKNNI